MLIWGSVPFRFQVSVYSASGLEGFRVWRLGFKITLLRPPRCGLRIQRLGFGKEVLRFQLFFQVFSQTTRLPPEFQKCSALEPESPQRDLQDKPERSPFPIPT